MNYTRDSPVAVALPSAWSDQDHFPFYPSSSPIHRSLFSPADLLTRASTAPSPISQARSPTSSSSGSNDINKFSDLSAKCNAYTSSTFEPSLAAFIVTSKPNENLNKAFAKLSAMKAAAATPAAPTARSSVCNLPISNAHLLTALSLKDSVMMVHSLLRASLDTINSRNTEQHAELIAFSGESIATWHIKIGTETLVVRAYPCSDVFGFHVIIDASPVGGHGNETFDWVFGEVRKEFARQGPVGSLL